MRFLPFKTSAPSWLSAGLLAAALALAPAAAHAQGVGTQLLPGLIYVAPGADFVLDLVVPVADSPFNGFHAVLEYDPAALTFLQASPLSAQVGCVMSGGCSAACGNTFHVFHAAGDSLSVDLSLLCDTITLPGPGQLYRYRFHASSTPQTTIVSTRKAAFYNAGVFVNPVTTTSSTVIISAGVGVDGGGSTPMALRLSAEPNPTPGPVAFTVSAVEDGVQSLDVLDLSGRMVQHLSAGWQPRGTRRLSWDGTETSGERVPAGVYLVRLRAGTRTARARVAVIR